METILFDVMIEDPIVCILHCQPENPKLAHQSPFGNLGCRAEKLLTQSIIFQERIQSRELASTLFHSCLQLKFMFLNTILSNVPSLTNCWERIFNVIIQDDNKILKSLKFILLESLAKVNVILLDAKITSPT